MDLEISARTTERSEVIHREKYIFKFSSLFFHTDSDSGGLGERAKVVGLLEALLRFKGDVVLIS